MTGFQKVIFLEFPPSGTPKYWIGQKPIAHSMSFCNWETYSWLELIPVMKLLPQFTFRLDTNSKQWMRVLKLFNYFVLLPKIKVSSTDWRSESCVFSNQSGTQRIFFLSPFDNIDRPSATKVNKKKRGSPHLSPREVGKKPLGIPFIMIEKWEDDKHPTIQFRHFVPNPFLAIM